MAQQLEVLGGGPGRTGTVSLYVALEKLGYPCLHMAKIVKGRGDLVDMFAANEVARREGRRGDWSGLAEFKAAVDFPVCCFVEDLLAQNPNIKVVATKRDFDAWFDSVTATIGTFGSTPFLKPVWVLRCLPFFNFWARWFDMYTATSMDGWCGGRMVGPRRDREAMRRIYEERFENLKKVVPPKQLLLYHPREGWEPLCKFLGKPVPDEPFPNLNSTAEMGAILLPMKLFFWGSNTVACLAVAGAVVGAGVYVAKAWERSSSK